MIRWPDNLSLYINASPQDGIEYFDIWHTGGPGGPMIQVSNFDNAQAICSAIEELNKLRVFINEITIEARRLSTAVDKLEGESLELYSALGLHEDVTHTEAHQYIKILMKEYSELQKENEALIAANNGEPWAVHWIMKNK